MRVVGGVDAPNDLEVYLGVGLLLRLGEFVVEGLEGVIFDVFARRYLATPSSRWMRPTG